MDRCEVKMRGCRRTACSYNIPNIMNTTPPGPAKSGSNLPEYSVGEISAALKRTVESEYGSIRVRGEISGFKRHGSGHLYLSLKDETAVLDAVCWRGTATRLGITPEDGLEVIATGRLTTYGARSKYQLVIEAMEVAGEGALLKQLEDRRKKLAAEGLFDEDRKSPIPFLPETIGIVTSPTGAVIRDILHRLADRFPRRVLLWPVLVQGDAAAGQIAAAIAGFNALAAGGAIPRPDVLVVARGGGSLEDLWAFNEEVVVRAAAASEIPLISAVGHETDTTLIDFAADLRAPTPTAAAEIAVPVRAELVAQVMDLTRRLFAAEQRLMGERANLVRGLARGLRDPKSVIEGHMRRLDDLAEGLGRSLALGLERRRGSLREIAAALRPAMLRRRQADLARDVEAAHDRLRRDWARRKRELPDRLAALGRVLDSLSYRNVLERGFAVLRTPAGKPLVAAAEATAGLSVDIEFHDGHAGATITDGGRATARLAAARLKPRPGKPKSKPTDDTQGKLF